MKQFSLSWIIFFSMLSSTLCWGFSHDLRMLKDNRTVQHHANINYTKILNFWEEHKKDFVFHSQHQEVVLVMGNTGSGKTTLVSALIGRKLRAVKSKGYFVIVDDEKKIGTGSASKTLVPEVMMDYTRNVTYVDCSGFRDNRNVEYEISSLYFQNILMNQIEKIKLILVINYDSLKFSGNKNDFDDLFEHLSEFIRDLSKFHNGIALVAMKVGTIYEQSDDGTFFVSNDDKSVIDGIADYLRNKKEIYLNKTDSHSKYQMFVNFIDVLLEKKNNSYARIAIFRQPTRQGLLEDIPGKKAELNTTASMITENLQYIAKQKNDFGFALSKSSKMTVDQIVSDIFRNVLTNRLYTIGNEALTHYLQMEKQYCDIRVLSEQVYHAHDLFSEVTNIDEPKALFEKLLDVANTLNISLSLNNVDIISDDIEALQFFTTVANNNQDTHMMLLKKKMHDVINSIEQLKSFYEFLNHLEENLAAYSSQSLKNDARIKNIMASCRSATSRVVEDINSLGNVAKAIGSSGTYQKIKKLKLNEFELKHLSAIFSTFVRKLEYSCASTFKPMTVKGYNVKMSDVIKINCWTEANTIQIFALNKIFIDQTVSKIGTRAQLHIIAPTWEVVGAQKIILDGEEGKPHDHLFAKSAFSNSENGVNGSPGLPGGSAGQFYGIGERFINTEYLEIHANGGRGGPGQHGGNGADGTVGEGLPQSFFDNRRDPDDFHKYFKDYNYAYTYSYLPIHCYQDREVVVCDADVEYSVKVSGIPAKKPTAGGDGGAGGRGGYSGGITINGLGKSSGIRSSNKSGYTGSEGRGGHGGKKTSEGRQVEFKYSFKKVLFFIPWARYSGIKWSDGAEVPAGADGKPGANDKNKRYPTTMTATRLFSVINSFKDFVRMNLFEDIKESELRNFISVIENNKEIKAEYDTHAAVREFKGLEDQFLELRNKIDLTPFYNSLLRRVEEYAKSEQVLENKKVLSYVYTAALTKLFTLNNKRKSEIVVDLNKYLDIIEKSVKEINRYRHLLMVRQYQDDYKNTLNKKIQEANDFIQNKIEPEIDRLWEESDHQIQAIVNEINENRNSTKKALEKLEKNRIKIKGMMQLRATLLPLKLAGTFLSFVGPIGAGVGVAVTSVTTIAEGVVLDGTSDLGQNRINTLDPNLKVMSRVTEVFNNKHQLVTEKLSVAMAKLEEYEKQLSETDMDRKRKLKELKSQLREATFRKTSGFIESVKKLQDVEAITKEMTMFANSERDFLEKKKAEEMKIEELTAEKKYEKRLRLINHAQAILNGAEIVFSFTRKLENDKGLIRNIDIQISDTVNELKALEKMENQVYSIIIPDIRQIEETINDIKSSINGSSHVKLDLTKWNVQTTLRDIKSLLQKFTHKMTFELQSNLQRYIEKIDEGFSILIDIYDRIDSYGDSVKQAEYIAHIESASMNDIRVMNSELDRAVNDLKLMIYSNMLTEKYEIALHAFKQHYFPFAARVLQRFQLPAAVQLRDAETLRSRIIDKINDMKNHIDESKAAIGQYSKYTHRKKMFNSNTVGSSPFYVWKHHAIRNEIQQLLNGSEIIIKADIAKGLFHNAVKYNDIGINFKFNNETQQKNFTSVLKNFVLTMTMIGNNYYRCGERYYFISFDEEITISYTLHQDEERNWINPNEIYTLIHSSHTFLSPYGLWSIKLQSVNKSISFDHLNIFANETIDLELVGRGFYIEQNPDFNFEVCDKYLDTTYDVENIAKVLA